MFSQDLRPPVLLMRNGHVAIDQEIAELRIRLRRLRRETRLLKVAVTVMFVLDLGLLAWMLHAKGIFGG